MTYDIVSASDVQHDGFQYLYVMLNDRCKPRRHLSPYITTEFYLVMRKFKIYSLSSFQICDIVLLAIVTMVSIISYDFFIL